MPRRCTDCGRLRAATGACTYCTNRERERRAEARQQAKLEALRQERERASELARLARRDDLGRRVARHFQERYGENWREVMEARAEGR